jgi:hypothetical protein
MGGGTCGLLDKLPLSLPSCYCSSMPKCEVRTIRATEEKEDAWNDAARLGVSGDAIYLKTKNRDT